MKKILVAIIFSLLPFTFYLKPVSAAVCGDTVPTNETELNSYVSDCNTKLKNLSGQKATLAQALGVLTTQINLTQAKIAEQTTQLNKLEIEIVDLSGKIQSLDYSLTDLTKLFVARVKSSYINTSHNRLSFLFHFSGFTEFAKGLQYVEKVRDHDQQLLLSLEKSRLDFDLQRTMKEKKQAEIEVVKKNLDKERSALATQVAAKNKLLADTKNDEARFQSLLSAAQAQLAAFRRFATTQGGASILSNQTKCDSGGCY